MLNDNDTATVKDLVEFLEKNFKPEQKLAFFDEGGAYCELVGIPKGMFGKMFFGRVGDFKKDQLEKSTEEYRKYIIESFKDVNDDDVVIY